MFLNYEYKSCSVDRNFQRTSVTLCVRCNQGYLLEYNYLIHQGGGGAY